MFTSKGREVFLSAAFVLIAGCGLAAKTRIEPQVPLRDARQVVFHPRDRNLVLVRENLGAISLWQMADPKRPVRVLSIFTRAQIVAFGPDAKSIVAVSLRGKLQKWRFDGTLEWESQAHKGQVVGLAVAQIQPHLFTADGDGLWQWSADGTARKPLDLSRTISAIALSPNARLLVVGYRDGSLRIWTNESGSYLPFKTISTASSEQIRSIDFAGAGDVFVTGGLTGELQLWNADGSKLGNQLHTADEDRRLVQVAFAPTGDYVVVLSIYDDGDPENRELKLELWNLDGSARLVDATTEGGYSASLSSDGTRLALAGPNGLSIFTFGFVRWPRTSTIDDCGVLAFSPTSDVFTVSCGENQAQMWSFKNARVERQGKPFKTSGSTLLMTISPQEHLLATGSEDGTMGLWRPDGVPVWKKPIQAHPSLPAIAFSRDEKTIASFGLDDGMLKIWNLDGTPKTNPISTGKAATDQPIVFAFSWQNPLLARGFEDGSIRLWDFAGAMKSELTTGSGKRISSLAFSPQDGSLVAADEAGMVYRWSKELVRIGEPFSATSRTVVSMAQSPRGDSLAIGTDAPDLLLSNVDGSHIDGLDMSFAAGAAFVTFSRNGNLLAAVDPFDNPTSIALFNLKLVRELVIPQQKSVPLTILPSPGGEIVAAEGPDHLLRLWNSDGTLRTVVRSGHKVTIDTIAFSPDGQSLASSDVNGVIRLWSDKGTPIGEPIQSNEPVHSLAVGGNALAWVAHNQLRIWREGTGIYDIPATTAGEIYAVAASPLQDYWITGGGKGSICIWNWDGSLRASFTGHADPVLHIAVSPDGKRFASTDGRHIREWQTSGSPVGREYGISGPKADSSFSGPNTNFLIADGITDLSFSSNGKYLAAVTSYGSVWRKETNSADEPKEWDIGIPLKRVGFNKNALWVSNGADQIFYRDSAGHLIGRMVISDSSMIVLTATGWYSGQGDLVNDVRVFSDGILPANSEEAARHFSAVEIGSELTDTRSWWRSVTQELGKSWFKIQKLYSELPSWLKVTFWPTAIYACLLTAMLATWLIQPAKIAVWAMPSFTSPQLPPWKVITEALSLIGWLGHTQRALDAWLSSHDSEFQAKCFEDREAVLKRSTYVDFSDGRQDAEALVMENGGEATAYWLSGPGGCGKSTLAFRLARLARRNTEGHPVLPILIDSDWSKSLVGFIAETLRSEDCQPTERMIKRLAHTRRLLVIVDGLSERGSIEAASEIAKLRQEGILQALIVTSRDLAPKGDGFVEIPIGPLDGKQLGAFVKAYVPETRVASAQASLLLLTKGKPIRPLFARLALDRLNASQSLPESYPELIQSYVVALRPGGHNSLREDDFLRAGRLVAFASVKDEWVPRQVSTEYLRGLLEAERSPFLNSDIAPCPVHSAAVLDQLVRCGLLESITHLGGAFIRFSFDPVAEYLAAMHMVSHDLVDCSSKESHAEGNSGLAEAIRRVQELK
jgi:WD40 repeat protein